MDGVQRGAGRDEQGFPVGAAEEQLRRALGNIDCADEFAGRVVNVDLAGGDENVAFGIFGDAFAAYIGEKLQIRERAIFTDRGAVGLFFGFIGNVKRLANLRGRQAKCAKHVVNFGAVIQLAGDKIFTGRNKRAAIQRNKLVRLLALRDFGKIVFVAPDVHGKNRSHAQDAGHLAPA